jgi:hypothetical protein
MSWWNPFGWSGGFGADPPEGIWGAQPATFRAGSMLGEGSVVEVVPADDAGVSSSILGDIASGFGTAGAGFSQGGFGISSGFYEPAATIATLQRGPRRDEPLELIDTMGVGFAA